MSTTTRLVISVLAIALSIVGVFTLNPRLGLDLKGGTQITLDLTAREGGAANNKDLASRTLEVLRQRVNGLGVSEARLSTSGNNRIIVDLPGYTDSEQAKRAIGSTAQLTIHPVLERIGAQPTAQATPIPAPTASASSAPLQTVPQSSTPPSPPTTAAGLGERNSNRTAVLGQDPGTTTTAAQVATPAESTATSTPATPPTSAPVQDQTSAITASEADGTTYKLGPAVVTGEGISDSQALAPNQNRTRWGVEITFNNKSEKAWTKLTAEEACKPQEDPTRLSAFVLDGKIIEVSGPAPDVQCNVGIVGPQTVIESSTFTMKEARTLSLLIKGGALPANVSIASSRYVGPELGEAAIQASKLAIIIGGVLTVLFVWIYYRLLGLVAGIALGAYALISYAVLLRLGLTLSLPGIAGFVLAVAMAMDSNILVYERVKEEFANGRSLRQSAQLGFKNALSAIVDSNTTAMLAAAVLFFFAVGEVKGFGVTLLIGTLISLFVTLVVLRTLVTGLLSLDWAHSRPKMLGLYVGAKFRKRMNENPPNLMGMTKWFLSISFLVLVLALVGIGVRGINYGIEFAGGRSLEYKTATPVNLESARDGIAKLGVEGATVQHTGNSEASSAENTAVRAKHIDADEASKIQNLMKELGGGKADQVQDTTVGPSFSDELKRKALIGLAAGVTLQLIWVAFRFRWTFGVGAVIAMVHDALFILGLFAWLGKEFNAIFLAALLTIVAYSVNDTVVIFDRIREQRRRRAGENFAHVVSDACAQTFPRTVNLSLSALFILGALYVLGGDTLSDFSLALILGVITGVFSSIAIASPIAVLLERWKPAITARQSSASARRTHARAKASTITDSVDVEANDSDAIASPRPASTGARPNPRPRKKRKRR